MKRILSLLLAVLLAAALFAGCGLLGSPEGTYTVQTINGKSVKDYYTTVAKEEYGVDLTGLLSLLGIDLEHPEELMSIVLKEDGTAEYRSGLLGDAKVASGTWKQEGGKLTLTLAGETKELDYRNGKITLELGSASKPMTVVLGK